MTTFNERLRAASQENASLLCVGLDIDPDRVPRSVRAQADWIVRFNRGIVDATSDLVCAYKPNLAFYEALGHEGWGALKATLELIPDDVPVIADAKRGDVDNTAARYASALFDYFGFHAATVNPYLGHDSLAPFLGRADRGVLVVCKTSNPGSGDLQDVLCQYEDRTIPLWEMVAERIVSWNQNGNCGLVVGATYPAILERVRGIAPDLPILIPGVGPQEGDLEGAVCAGAPEADSLAIINASRQVIYASSGDDWQDAARAEAQALRDAINRARPAAATAW